MEGRLLEREDELAALERFLDDAADGRGRLVLVEGAAGIGKTRLLEEARTSAGASGFRVLAARAGELESEFPYGVARQLFEPVLGDDAFAGAAASARAVFDPTAGAEEGDASFAALHGLYWLALNLAREHPLLLAVDDLHWCDRPSLRFLAYLARRLEGQPVLGVASLRPGAQGPDAAVLTELAADPQTEVLRPGPLGAEAVLALVRERLGSEAEPGFAAVCGSATGGNPLLLGELLKALAAEGVAPDADGIDAVRSIGPRAVSRSVLLRLSRVAPETAAVARALAILGDGTEPALTAALAGVDGDVLAGAVGELVRTEIIRPESPPAFVHPLVREAIRHDVAPVERDLLHARAAALLADRGAAPEQIAAHLVLAPRGAHPWAADVLHEAGRAAMRRGAGDSAVAYLRRALDEGPHDSVRPTLLFELGTAEGLDDGPAAVEHLREAYEAEPNPAARPRIAATLGRLLGFLGRAPEAVAVLRESVVHLPPHAEELRLELEAIELTVGWLTNDAQVRTRMAGNRTLPARGTGSRMLLAMSAVEWGLSGGSAEECSALALAATADGALVEARGARDVAFVCALRVLAAADRDEALAEGERALAHGHSHGSPFDIAAARLWNGYVRLQRGDLPEAVEHFRAAREEIDRFARGDVPATMPRALLAEALLERGDVDAARAVIGEVDRAADRGEPGRMWMQARLALEVAEGRWDDAVATADEVASRWSWVVGGGVVTWRARKARALAGLGRTEEADILAEVELSHARAWGAPGTLGAALRLLGELRDDPALLEEAVATTAGSPARLQHARSLAALGALREALELAAACGADGLVAELRAAGAEAAPGAGSLTPTEHQAAELAAEGRSDHEIAQALYATPRAVEVHLANACRKLGVASRGDLGAALRVR